MNSDHTQQQSLGELQRAEQMSMHATRPPADIPGFRIEKLLGQGAFGQVWLARDLNTGRKVAIKFYLHRGGINWSLLSREVKNLVNMSTGRHIVQVLGVGWDAEPPFYVMEYFENGSLEDLIRAHGALSIPHTSALLKEIANGLTFAHGKGVLHCDLKPANVVLDHDMNPRLADFGQSRMLDEQTPSLGTLFYMAPEQADLNSMPDAQWDVYALGAIAYTMLVGSPPYRTPEVVERLDTAANLPERLAHYQRIIQNSPRPKLHYRRRGIDKTMCQIVDKCLDRSTDIRYSNVQQVIEALEQRDQARMRQPLYILGIIGPMLLLVLILLFSARSISMAKQDSLERVQQRSLESNNFAAMFAARTLEREIDSLFQLVEAEAAQPDLRELIESVASLGKVPLLELVQPGSHDAVREDLRSLPERIRLEEYITRGLQALYSLEGNGDGAAIFNSVFVNDRYGTNLGISFSDPDEVQGQSPVGRNFAYRSYFNGLTSDGDPSLAADSYQPTRRTRLSSVFRSTTTGRWKVGVSSPVWPESSLPESGIPPDAAQPIGVITLTINLGDFELLADSSEVDQNRFAALVDGRSGNEEGILLHHPILPELERRSRETQRVNAVPQIDRSQLEHLKSGGMVKYQDPASRFDGGEVYAGDWIAAMQQVQLPRSRANANENRSKSDLWLLVQERGDAVSQPIRQLGTKLQIESYLEIVAMLAVMLLLWFFVFRYGGSIGKKMPLAESQTLTSNQHLEATIDLE
ncbi:MAG: serine/threonine protein kinase [Planctomycetales bacterium]|nr:serine/threonine protein kinase [Planctomycetales bacterium]